MIFRFIRSDAMSERLGEMPDHVVEYPHAFAQLTYTTLRDLDGNDVAWFDTQHDAWAVPVDTERIILYSDVVIAGDVNV